MALPHAPTRTARRQRARTTALLAAALLAAVLLGLVVPVAHQGWLAHACEQRGGRLTTSTEAVEPLVSARTVHRCLGPDGQSLER
jgi:ferric-dicitrate binding protein FerR (iron transport regulator)